MCIAEVARAANMNPLMAGGVVLLAAAVLFAGIAVLEGGTARIGGAGCGNAGQLTSAMDEKGR
jgi:hypothetical protein